MLAAISGEALINAVVWIIIAGIIYWLLTWAIAKIGLPEPFAKVANVIIILCAVLLLINALLTIAGHPMVVFR